MLNLKQIYEIEPSLKNLPEEEVLSICADLYNLGEIALESFIEHKKGSKNL